MKVKVNGIEFVLDGEEWSVPEGFREDQFPNLELLRILTESRVPVLDYFPTIEDEVLAVIRKAGYAVEILDRGPKSAPLDDPEMVF